MRGFRYLMAGVAALSLFVGVGCGGGKVKVNGVVTLDGKPIEGAMVTFHPKGGQGKSAFGTTDKDGNFQLTTKDNNDGAFAGEYNVTVVYAEGAAAPPADDVKGAMTGMEKASRGKQKAPKFIVPAKYATPDQSPLKQTVPPSGKVTLDLKSQ